MPKNKKWQRLSKLAPGTVFITKEGELFLGSDSIWANGSDTIRRAYAFNDPDHLMTFKTSTKVHPIDIERLLLLAGGEELEWLMRLEGARGDGVDPDDCCTEAKRPTAHFITPDGTPQHIDISITEAGSGYTRDTLDRFEEQARLLRDEQQEIQTERLKRAEAFRDHYASALTLISENSQPTSRAARIARTAFATHPEGYEKQAGA